MKKNKLYITVCIGLAFVGFSSCSDWLDVRPKSEILADLHFERESGFRDQLAGVYNVMSETSMYGRDLTFGLTSVLAQDYDLPVNNTYRYAVLYNYEETTTKNIINSIWSRTYNAIANLNELLQYIDKVDAGIFTDNNHDLYKGEAIGLRAFLHLDMLRLFSPSPAANGSAMAVPYVTAYDKVITPQRTVTETIDLIIADLEQAGELLKVDVMLNPTSDNYNERMARKIYFNYYAAIATLARAYMYKGDTVNALKYAEIIITEGEAYNSNFAWTHYSELDTSYDYEVNRLYTRGLIFYLSINNLKENVDKYFTSAAGDNALSPSDEKADDIYERTSKGYGNDYRLLKGFAYDGAKKYIWKYHQPEQGKHNNIMPMIRKNEAYYIAAEILKASNPARSAELLNLARAARNLETFTLPDNLSPNEIQDEVFKEYRKEYIAEGQTFFYYKRLNLSTIVGAGVSAGQQVYVLPMPDNEIEFGERQ